MLRPFTSGTPTYAERMLTFLILVVLIVAGVAAWKMRVPLLAKMLGQSEDRVRRQLNRRRD